MARVQARAAANAETAATLGLLYVQANALADAEEWYRKSLELKPDTPEVQFRLALLLIDQKQYDGAAEVLEQAFQTHPDHLEIGNRLATLYADTGKAQQADETYTKLLEVENLNIDLLARAGRFYAGQGKIDRAREIGERILALDEEHAAGLFLRGEAHYQMREYDEAKISFAAAASRTPSPQYHEAHGRSAEQLNRYNEALEAYTEAVRLDPNYQAAKLGQARVFIARREFPKALKLLEEVEKSDPRNPLVQFHLGECLQAQDQHRAAVRHFEESLRRAPKRAMTHYMLGRSARELDDLRDASKALILATNLARRGPERDAPWVTDAFLELGYIERSRSQRRSAIKAWDAYLKRVPEDQRNSLEVKEVRKLLMSLKAQVRR